MLPIGDKPLLELIIGQLRDSGIHRVHVTTHYLPETITGYFGDGKSFGVDISYVSETRPLGTAGALKLMKTLDEPLLVINGDILSRIDFRDMLAYHTAHRPDLTIGVRHYDIQVPYGVVDFDGPRVRAIREKPVLDFLVNAGIYLIEPSISRYIPDDLRFDMTDLVQCLLNEGRLVVGFPIVEYWLDVGQHADYERAQQDVKNGRL
jgi:NDP-sugar pyrophosphorylase family protein